MMDGMDDMNTPPPPMGVNDMDGGMDDPMGGPMGGGPGPDAEGGMDDPMGGMDDPTGGDQDPMGGDQNPMGGDDEFMNKFNQLSKEDQVAVEKYTDSMLDDSGADGQMPMETYRSIKNIIDETINDVLDNREGTKRPEKKLNRKQYNFFSPFKTPF